MNIIKSPQDNIEAYLYNEINIELYKLNNDLDKNEMLFFFNLLFKEFEFFCENNNNYLTIENHFKIRSDYNLEISSESDCDIEISSDMGEVIKQSLLYLNLRQLIDDKYPIEKRSGVLSKTCEHIEDVCRDISGFMDVIVGQGSTFDSLLESMTDYDNKNKIDKLLEVKYVHLRAPHLYYQEKLMSFNELCDLEIQKITELMKYETTQSEQPEVVNLSDTKHTDNNYLGQPTNDKANKFFEFLCEYYRAEENTQIKYVNILYYLKNDASKEHFIFKLSQKNYKELMVNRGIKISKFDKSANYKNIEKPIFHSLENSFLKSMTV